VATQTAAVPAPPAKAPPDESGVAPPNVPADERHCAGAPVIGHGFHPFDKWYFLFGGNAAANNRKFIWDGELSLVPPATDNLLWGGIWGSVGGSAAHHHPETKLADLRAGGGFEGGFRFLAADVGYMTDRGFKDYGPGIRLRLGIAIASEMITGSHARYRHDCCVEGNSATACECDRFVGGVSLFAYVAFEGYLRADKQPLPMFGLSAKVAVGP